MKCKPTSIPELSRLVHSAHCTPERRMQCWKGVGEKGRNFTFIQYEFGFPKINLITGFFFFTVCISSSVNRKGFPIIINSKNGNQSYQSQQKKKFCYHNLCKPKRKNKSMNFSISNQYYKNYKVLNKNMFPVSK